MIRQKGMMMKKKVRFKLSTTHIILLSFLAAIIVGSILLTLPISTQSGKSVPYIDALFTATTSVCVTGLVTVPTVLTWSVFGQVVILVLIQIGGLGIITIMSGIMIFFHQKLSIGNRILIQDAFNLNTLSGLVKFTKKVLVGTFIIEGVGALLYMFVFIPEFGAKGIWISIFNSVSAFCNAGIDIIAEDSLCRYALNPMVNIITSILIILGGLGYVVWWDVIRVLKTSGKRKIRCFKGLTLHSKIVLSVTLFLIISGAVCFFAFEYNNPNTIGNYSLGGKIQASLFQSVTTRTAGFATIPQENLTNASAIVALLLMFIGGSPVGTAGGIKTVTIAILIASAFSTIRNKESVSLFNRTVPKQAVSKSVAVVSMSFIIMFISTVLLSTVTSADAIDVMYETVSATATVGLTRSLTPVLNTFGKIIVALTMYLGRVGPISLMVAFNIKKQKKIIVNNPEEEVNVG